MDKTVINTPDAPAPIGPYNQAILSGNTLYVSGQIAIDPQSGNMITDNITDETHQVMKNLGSILKAAGFDYNKVVKCSIFVNAALLKTRFCLGIANSVVQNDAKKISDPLPCFTRNVSHRRAEIAFIGEQYQGCRQDLVTGIRWFFPYDFLHRHRLERTFVLVKCYLPSIPAIDHG